MIGYGTKMPTSREDFARLASEYLRVQGEHRPVRYDAPRDRLVVGEGDFISFIGLQHGLAEYDAVPHAEKPRVLARRLWSSIRRDSPLDEVNVIRSIVPRLRDRAWFSAIRRQAELELGADEEAINEVMLPHRVLNAELAAHLAFDLPTSVMEFGPDRLEAFGLDFDELFDRAVQNLRERPRLDFDHPDAAVAAFVSPYRDGFDATRMLLTERFLELPVRGNPVVLSPTHDIVLVAGDDDEVALEAIATWGEQALLEPKPHTAHAFRWDGTTWTPWLPPPGHRAWQKLKVLQLQSFASAYARQKEVLEALLQGNGHSLLVSSLRAFRTPRGDIFTSTAWTEGVDALLPQTDRIDFVTVGGSAGRTYSTTFEVARQTVPHLMSPTGDTPERWRTSGFPTVDELSQMAEAGRLVE
ncbi:MAG: hypothetical protein INH41_03820 [Myxococcaceae bacterium]|nr:hypothetical protein [Myxococcaceae bacterium]